MISESRCENAVLVCRNGWIDAAVDWVDASLQRKQNGLLLPHCRTLWKDLSKDSIGILYQIRDDYVNVMSEEYAREKCFFEDLTEGKVHLPNSPHQQFSYPIICYISKNPEDHRLINILKQHTTKEELKLYAKKLLEESVVVVDGT